MERERERKGYWLSTEHAPPHGLAALIAEQEAFFIRVPPQDSLFKH